MDTEPPVSQPAVHIYTTNLDGLAAIQVTGEDGEQYCVIDSAVLVGDPDAREHARRVFLRAQGLAARYRVALAS